MNHAIVIDMPASYEIGQRVMESQQLELTWAIVAKQLIVRER